MIPYDDSDFESRFQAFLEKGAFKQPALREDIERELLDEKFDPQPKKLKVDEKCPHGMRPLVCSKCYFEGPGYTG